jgi:hypothetical protein
MPTIVYYQIKFLNNVLFDAIELHNIHMIKTQSAIIDTFEKFSYIIVHQL